MGLGMHIFELWLDESGDFENDYEKIKAGKKTHPSLIGGMLVADNSFPDSFVKNIIPESGTYHSVAEIDQLSRFKAIEEKLFKNDHNRFIVFNNQECLMIIDNNLTYLNVISEGIMQLIINLKARYGDICLKVVIANRIDTTKGAASENSIVDSDEYVKRLKEKLIISSLEKNISDSEWELNTASARKDKRLMLADIICNTFYTRNNTKKFDEEQRRYIEEVYCDVSRTVVFTVFESVLEKNFKNYLIENKIGEAIASVCLSDNTDLIGRYFSLLSSNYNSCGIHEVALHYRFIEAYIEYYIKVVRNFDLCIVFLNNLLDHYVPLLMDYKTKASVDYAKRMSLDINFYMLTVYTHMGKVKEAQNIEIECDRKIQLLPDSLETVNYRIKYEIRKVNGLINTYNYTHALSVSDRLVEKCREVKEFLDLISDNKKIYYEELGKALGTRLQIKAFLLRFDRSLYGSAIFDFDEAVDNFSLPDDKKRQYLYRVKLETEYGNYEEAFKYLLATLDLNNDKLKPKDIWENIYKQSVFVVEAFIRLISEGLMNKWERAGELFSVINNSDYIVRLYLEEQSYHPAEIILWKYATSCYLNGETNACDKYYNRAIDICYEDNNNITLNVIGIAIEFEYISFLMDHQISKAKTRLKRLRKRWEERDDDYEQDIIKNVFGDVDFQSKNSEYYMNLSRMVTY